MNIAKNEADDKATFDSTSEPHSSTPESFGGKRIMEPVTRNSSGLPVEVLIVDDEAYVRDVLTHWLAAEGYICYQATNGEEALRILEEHEIALVITDILMPRMSGMTLLARIKKQFPDVAVIMLTALHDRKTAIRALQLGAYGYMCKPFDETEVLINVVNALERRRLTLASEEYERHLEQLVCDRTAEVRQREEEIVLRLVAASEFRDEETGAHIRRIGLYSQCLAEALGWSPTAASELRLAAPMHDIGKIGISDTILLKQGKLTPEEFEIIKQHTVIGAQILQGTHIPLIAVAKEIALCHHERWNGTGYPNGFARELIPEAARIVTVADVYDALVTNRVYRPALSEDEALALMHKDREGHFDPRVFDAFLKVLPEFRRIREEVAEQAKSRATLPEKSSPPIDGERALS